MKVSLVVVVRFEKVPFFPEARQISYFSAPETDSQLITALLLLFSFPVITGASGAEGGSTSTEQETMALVAVFVGLPLLSFSKTAVTL